MKLVNGLKGKPVVAKNFDSMESIKNVQEGVFIPMEGSRDGLAEKMEISFDSVSYTVKKGKKKNQQKTILEGISGIFHESELIAIMGASGLPLLARIRCFLHKLINTRCRKEFICRSNCWRH